jgi:hypothetical protein
VEDRGRAYPTEPQMKTCDRALVDAQDLPNLKCVTFLLDTMVQCGI